MGISNEETLPTEIHTERETEIEIEIINSCTDEWSEKATKLLLTSRLEMEKYFNRPTCKKKKLWQKISLEIGKKGYKFSADKCDLKYRNLLKTYKKNKEKQKKSGADSITWKYFEILDNVLGCKYNINPPPELVGGTLSDDDENENNVTNSESTTQNQNLINTSAARKSKRNDWKADYFKKKLELKKQDMERKEREWQEKCQIEKSKIETMKELIQVMREQNS